MDQDHEKDHDPQNVKDPFRLHPKEEEPKPLRRPPPKGMSQQDFNGWMLMGWR
jgi:hypothetical protein